MTAVKISIVSLPLCLWVCIIPPSFLADGWNENSPMPMCADVSASLQEEVVDQSFYALTH